MLSVGPNRLTDHQRANSSDFPQYLTFALQALSQHLMVLLTLKCTCYQIIVAANYFRCAMSNLLRYCLTPTPSITDVNRGAE